MQCPIARGARARAVKLKNLRRERQSNLFFHSYQQIRNRNQNPADPTIPLVRSRLTTVSPKVPFGEIRSQLWMLSSRNMIRGARPRDKCLSWPRRPNFSNRSIRSCSRRYFVALIRRSESADQEADAGFLCLQYNSPERLPANRFITLKTVLHLRRQSHGGINSPLHIPRMPFSASRSSDTYSSE